MRQDRRVAPETLDGAATDQESIVLVGGIALHRAFTGEHSALGAPLSGTGARPAREGQAMCDAPAFMAIEPAQATSCAMSSSGTPSRSIESVKVSASHSVDRFSA